MTPPRVHLVVGTRPEAIKMAPLVSALRDDGLIDPVVVATGQHPAMVAQALDAFDQRPDVVLELDRHTGEQAELVGQLSPALNTVVRDDESAAVVVQGDTTSALVGGLVAFWRNIPLVHLEAGLRSGDLTAPFPEEANRRLLGVVADVHLAPTPRAVLALKAEKVPRRRIVLVGNTVVDAVQTVAARGMPCEDPRLDALLHRVSTGSSRLVLVTVHRRESWGEPLADVLDAVRRIVASHPDVECVLPAHANPAVRAQVEHALGGMHRVTVTGPLPYPSLCRLLAASSVVLTDSGGIQEEAPSFGVPVLVLRAVTERREAIDAGVAELVGTDPGLIVSRAGEVLAGARPIAVDSNPFGDGRAGWRSARTLAWLLGLAARPAEWSLPTPGPHVVDEAVGAEPAPAV